MDPNNFTSKIHPKFICQQCDFKCFKTGDWNRHLATRKHKNLTNPNIFTSNYIENHHSCVCGKNYKHISTLCAHKKNATKSIMNQTIMTTNTCIKE